MQASNSLSRTFSATRLFLRRQLWIWPIVAGVILGLVGWVLRAQVENALKTSMADNLQTLLDADVTALRIWMKTQEEHVSTISEFDDVRRSIGNLAELAADENLETDALLRSPDQKELRRKLLPWLQVRHHNGFVVIDRKGRVIASLQESLIGQRDLPLQEGLIEKLNQGKPTITRPMKSRVLLKDQDGQSRAEVPTMFAIAPVRNDGGDVIAYLGLRIRPEADFTRILSIARAGDSGETYAFDKNGLLISGSRFDEELKQIGLLVDSDEARSILGIQIRDPQVNMAEGKRPTLRRSQQPLTRMAADAIRGNSGVDVDGYRDYRGVPVIGAWTWLPDYGFGIATEVDVAEAYRPLYILRYVFWGLFTLLGAAAVAIFVFTMIVSRMRRTARQAVLKAKRLGQYRLEEKIGAGGMGVVYRGHHDMLRRPTAIKLLDVEKTTPETIARFEREVQLTSQLCHPNTIAVYDYGRTPEGVFYYAMEYLDGINLEELIREYGPLPEGRVIFLLRQVCGSLAEAHGIGLIHRDIKPANMIVSQRGGMADVVKLLDFGLVKAIDSEKQVALTAAEALTGTPLYLSPEAIESPDRVDARSDLYAVGAVGYYLLTGTPVFEGSSVVEICMQQVKTAPVPPSERRGKPVAEDLQTVLLTCLEKDPHKRPQTARELLSLLQNCVNAGDWSEDDAVQWWETQYQGKTRSTDRTAASKDTSCHEENTLIVSQAAEET